MISWKMRDLVMFLAVDCFKFMQKRVPASMETVVFSTLKMERRV